MPRETALRSLPKALAVAPNHNDEFTRIAVSFNRRKPGDRVPGILDDAASGDTGRRGRLSKAGEDSDMFRHLLQLKIALARVIFRDTLQSVNISGSRGHA
ncbi:hypothetical protein [Sinorhizobium chiapasense]|uniref:Uncharacterized protein n=1 Tax=Sinorhizobium chiapasense TaxID=501572 RepID=A0ABZ2BJ18_9HYPH